MAKKIFFELFISHYLGGKPGTASIYSSSSLLLQIHNILMVEAQKNPGMKIDTLRFREQLASG